MSIHEIARRTLNSTNSRYYFSRDTLAYFGQTIESFTVKKCGAYYRISAPSHWQGKFMGDSVRYFDPQTNELLTEKEYNRIEEVEE
jgi:hypothetical protein